MTIIDSHVHLHDPEEPLPDHELFFGFEARLEDLIEDHERHDVDGAVFVPMDANPKNLAYSQRCSDRYPGQSAIIGIYDHEVDDPLERYRREIDQYDDLQGLRVQSLRTKSVTSPRDLDIWPVLEELEARDHCLWIYPTTEEYALVDEIAAQLSDLKVVYNLLGFPLPDGLPDFELDERGLPNITRWTMPDDMPDRCLETLLESGNRSNTYVLWGTHWQYADEPYPYEELIDHSRRLRSAFGADHMAFITDWPWMRTDPGYNDLLDLIDLHLPELSEDERADIMGGTAQRLLDF